MQRITNKIITICHRSTSCVRSIPIVIIPVRNVKRNFLSCINFYANLQLCSTGATGRKSLCYNEASPFGRTRIAKEGKTEGELYQKDAEFWRKHHNLAWCRAWFFKFVYCFLARWKRKAWPPNSNKCTIFGELYWKSRIGWCRKKWFWKSLCLDPNRATSYYATSFYRRIFPVLGFFVECRKSLFTRFYNHRETNVIPEEETRLSDAKKKRDVVLKEQRQLEQAIKESNEKSPGKRQHADVNKVRLSKFYNVLINLGVKKVKKPKTPSPMYVWYFIVFISIHCYTQIFKRVYTNMSTSRFLVISHVFANHNFSIR